MAPTQMAKQLLSALIGEVVDQDHNAAKNLRYWPELNASSALVEASVPIDTQAAGISGTDPSSDGGMTRCQRSDSETSPQEKARRGAARIEPDDCQAKNLERGVA